MDERDVIDASEALDYQQEEDAGHSEGMAALEDLRAEEVRAERLALERFCIHDEATANWYLRKLRNLENEKDTIKAQAAAMLKALDTEIHSLEFRFGPQFETFVRGELDRRGGHSKTLPLFQGTAAFRTVPGSLRLRNMTEAIEHARAQGWDAIKTVETLDADRYKKEAAAVRQETGELLPGIEVIEERENFTIRWGKSNDAPEGQNEQ